MQRKSWVLISLCLLLFIDSLSLGVVIPVFAPLFADVKSTLLPAETTTGMRNFLYSIALVIPMISMLFGAPILGGLSDRFGRRIILLTGLSGVLTSFTLSTVALLLPSIVLLFISRVLAGFMDGTHSIAQAAIADISQTNEKVSNMSLVTLSSTLGFIVGPVIGGILSDSKLVSWFHYTTPFILAIILTACNLVLLYFSFTETNEQREKKKISFLQSLKQFVFGFTDKRIVILSFGYILMQFSWGGYFELISLIWVNLHHYSPSTIGYFMTFLSLGFALSLFVVMKYLVHFLPTKQILILGMMTMTIGLLLSLSSLASEVLLWLSALPIVAGVAMSYNTMLALFSNAVTPEEQGKVMGTSFALLAVAWLLAGFVIGSVSGASYLATMIILSSGSAVGLVVVLFYKPVLQKTAKP